MKEKNKNMADIGIVRGAIRKAVIGLIIGFLFRDFLFGRLIIYIILGSVLLTILLLKVDEVKTLKNKKSKEEMHSPGNMDPAHLSPVTLPAVKSEVRSRAVKMVYEPKELVLMELCCKNCGASEMKEEGEGHYSCVYCGTKYKSRECGGDLLKK